MADLISSLPNETICYILSFLPSQQVVATSVLSKRWNLLWCSVSSLDFDMSDDFFGFCDNEMIYNKFCRSVCSFLFRRGDQPLHRFRLRCYSTLYPTLCIKKWIKTAVNGSCRVQSLDLDCDWGIVMPSMVFSCKTLVVLKLSSITVEDIFFVDLPFLKILYLNDVRFPKYLDFSQLLSGCPNLEDLQVKDLACETKGKFNRLPKLVRAHIEGKYFLPLEIFKDVEVLFFYWIFSLNLDLDLDFDFPNLVQLELNLQLNKDWLRVLEVLHHCPKLQSLVICISKVYEKEDDWPYPQTVPTCMSSHLRTCCLKYCSGSKDEFQFARYVLENAKYLRSMKFCTFEVENDIVERELSSCMKRSDTCTLSFSIY